ncbi:unnamed protein product [Adineta steineri]|uniref:Protein-tyrosine sulfotransferase n=1 Tax=Adineta steineri TaxID=433720 RepID=A0A813R2Q8_9BILA|nr:unnamed protein product [Adineta steineri]CAF0775162.1 unnamed protein product [Adineta steineri]CAF3717012.1 unnamed protein product [Adineta steineri]CAF3856390.1 unnamed protein product [Adineta steineri]
MPCLSFRRRMLFNMYQRTLRSSFLCLIILFLTIIIVILLTFRLSNLQQECSTPHINVPQPQQQQQRIRYNSSSEHPVIFIGGMPRSGTTLMRAILDSHPLVRCGEETRVIPRILSMRAAWKKSPVEWNRLIAGGISESMIDSAVRAFVYEILLQHGKHADVLCDKDPFVLKYTSYISSIFPNAKFLLLIRDARAVIHSVMTRKVTITGFSLSDYRQNLRLWNKGIETMVNQCTEIGKDKCLMVYYEQLVLQPKKTIADILKYLNLPWVESVLHHEELVGKKISLSKTEHSSDQVIKPINTEALTKWVDHIPKDIKNELDTLAPMLKKLGYDIQSDVPTYGVADQLVLDNMNKLKENADFWNAKAKSYARQAPNDTRPFQNQSAQRTIH